MLSKRERAELLHLRRRKDRSPGAPFLTEGLRLVEDLAASPLSVRWAVAASDFAEAPRARMLLHTLARQGVPVREVAPRELAALAATETPQGILAVATQPAASLDALAAPGDAAVLLVLDAVQDPGNFGTLVRTAEALGACAVAALPGTVDAWNPKSVRAAMGSSFRLPIVETRWDELAPWLERHGLLVLAAAAGADPLRDPPARAALVLGNEGAGIGEATRAAAQRLVGIRLRGRAESLNVAAAGAILLHELLRPGR